MRSQPTFAEYTITHAHGSLVDVHADFEGKAQTHRGGCPTLQADHAVAPRVEPSKLIDGDGAWRHGVDGRTCIVVIDSRVHGTRTRTKS